jgi:hypothetical protein
MLTNQASSLAPEVAVELQVINQSLNDLLVEWQAVMAKEGATPAVSTQYYDKAVKLIEQKRALEAGLVPAKKSPPAEGSVVQAEVAPATAITPPIKKLAKKKAKVKVVLAMQPDTVVAEVPLTLPAPAPEGPPFEITNAVAPTPSKPVVHSYGDGEALADGTLVDVSSLKVEVKGMLVTRMTTAIFARMDVAAKAFQQECEQLQVPFVLAVAWRNWIVSQIKQAVIKGDILQVPRTPTSGAIWIMENEGGGFTMLAPSDY